MCIEGIHYVYIIFDTRTLLFTNANVEHQWNGFKIVSDNLDEMVKPRYMSLSH